jgi:hypothetical protein
MREPLRAGLRSLCRTDALSPRHREVRSKAPDAYHAGALSFSEEGGRSSFYRHLHSPKPGIVRAMILFVDAALT